MSALDDKRKENLKKNVKYLKSKARSCCSRDNIWRVLVSVTVLSVVIWMFNAVYILHETRKEPILAVNFNPDVHKAQGEFGVLVGGLRGDADQEWLVLPSPEDPVEFESNWYIPPVTKPLEMPPLPMKRLNDHSSNYVGTAARKQHGDIGKRPDGQPHSWEKDLAVPLDREFPDYRRKECSRAPFYDPEVVANMPAVSVVIIFSNEPWETLMRSVHSVLNNTPPHLLYEIILVDDGSTFDEYTVDGSHQLVDYIKCCLPPKVKYTRTGTRAGITRARVTGINLVKSDIFVILDSHIEAEPGWMEPLVYKIQEDPTAFVMPMIDSAKKDAHFTPAGGGVGCSLGLIWKVMEHALHPQQGVSPDHRILKEPWGYISSPSMSGGLFGGNKQVFLDLGGYDLAMEGWGAENVEFGLRLWQCGAQLHCSECSRVAHIFGRGQFYKQKGGEAVMNRLRTAGVWMDEFGVLPWIFNGKPTWKKMGQIDEMMQMRKNLQCHDFKWFLKNVWPESPIHDLATDLPYHGFLTHKATGSCVESTRRTATLKTSIGRCEDVIYYSRSQRIGSGKDDESYLEDLKFDWPRPDERRQLFNVEVVTPGTTEDVVRIIHVKTNTCLAVTDPAGGNVIMAPCDDGEENQLWTWTKFTLDDKTYYLPENF